MKTTLRLLASSFLLASLSPCALAETEAYYSTVSPSDGAGPHYTTTVTPPAPPVQTTTQPHRDDPHDRFAFRFGINDSHAAFGADTPYTVVDVTSGHHHHHHRTPLHWVDRESGQPLPANAVIGNHLPRAPYEAFVCRSYYRHAVLPGKLISGFCHVSADGEEMALPDYQVLVSHVPLGWVPAQHGGIPMNAIAGGYERNDTLYICKAFYHGSEQLGKIVGESCAITWNGRELLMPRYHVLVM
jgi:hypothetical protein